MIQVLILLQCTPDTGMWIYPETAKMELLLKFQIILMRFPSAILKWESVSFPSEAGIFPRDSFSAFQTGGSKNSQEQDPHLCFLYASLEIDAEQPRVNRKPLFYKLRHYVNLKKTPSKLSALFETFKECSFVTCRKYIGK